MRLAVLAVCLSLLGTSRAGAESRVMLSPGPGYRIRWKAGPGHRFDASLRVERQGWSPVDRWFQVAPGGAAVAVWTAPTGLVVLGSNGAELWRRAGEVTAFRFSPHGDRLAFATARGVEVLALDTHEARMLTPLGGVDRLRWTEAGLVARAGNAVDLVDDDGHRRTLLEVRPGAAVAAAKGRVVTFAPSAMRELDVARADSRPTVTKLDDRDPVVDAELSPDGQSVLFATAKRVYLREGGAPVRRLAEIAAPHTLLFSPDGAAYLWVADSGGAVVRQGKSTPLPAGTRSARFRADGGARLVLTAVDGVSTWDPATGARAIVGGISPDDGVNLTGDLVGGGTALGFYYQKSGSQKAMQAPTAPLP